MPVVDIHTIGAGGGSLAYLEAGGLRVGPESAGAHPGPACYGRGGTPAHVTDANLYLGRIDPDYSWAATSRSMSERRKWLWKTWETASGSTGKGWRWESSR